MNNLSLLDFAPKPAAYTSLSDYAEDVQAFSLFLAFAAQVTLWRWRASRNFKGLIRVPLSCPRCNRSIAGDSSLTFKDAPLPGSTRSKGCTRKCRRCNSHWRITVRISLTPFLWSWSVPNKDGIFYVQTESEVRRLAK